MNIDMLNRLKSLEISEECLIDILEMINREVESSQKAEKVLPDRIRRVEDIKREIMNAKNGEERTIAIRSLGRAQKRVAHAESKMKKPEPKSSGIIFSPSSYS